MVVFHLKRIYFEMIRAGEKTCEYRFSLPKSLEVGSLLRFDLAYSPLSDASAHLFARCSNITKVRLLDCPQYVFDCFGLSFASSDSFIYRIDFDLQEEA